MNCSQSVCTIVRLSPGSCEMMTVACAQDWKRAVSPPPILFGFTTLAFCTFRVSCPLPQLVHRDLVFVGQQMVGVGRTA